ncbi:odorant receptor 131-2-like [Bufo bufo]|uniref:odorant receptor 131-2-like n=1 Tax=Bufo bufo TaxID=8384 RepID=UPI001ABECE38|nr:odorant receptor 131-2-like [Bufo bufo]
MLGAFFTNFTLQEEPRYILFTHMLINDTASLIIGLFLFFTYSFRIYFPVPVCYILVTASSVAFKVTPYNLAVMCLERFVAICFPLRHTEWCTPQKTLLAIVAIWIIGLIPNVIDFIILCSSVRSDYFFVYCFCVRADLIRNGAQDTVRTLTHISGFSLVGFIIVFTYINIMLVVMKFGSGKTVASKAGKTVMLHAFQLLLYMTAFFYNVIEVYLRKYFLLLPLINFFFFMFLPRFISPLIYGFWDEEFFKYIKRIVLCKSLRTFPNSGTI